jgi:hypothetical protein
MLRMFSSWHNIVECMSLPHYDTAEDCPIPRAELEWRRAVVH